MKLAVLIAAFRRVVLIVSASLRLSDAAICKASKGLDPYNDYHDWPDSEWNAPLHFTEHVCRRCGKTFYI